MFPTITHRICMIAAIFIGSWAWLFTLMPLRAADGSLGLSLMDTRVGIPLAVIYVFLAGLPALLLGLWLAAAGNPLSGIFTVAFSLMMLASQSGSIQHVFWRQQAHGLNTMYVHLQIEMILWTLAWCVMFHLINRTRYRLRPRVPHRLKTPYFSGLDEEKTARFTLDIRSVLSGLICAVTAGYLCHILIQSHNTGQVIGGLIIAFTFGGAAARIFLPARNPLYILISPLIVGGISYLWMARLLSQSPDHDILLLWQQNQLPGLGLTLPVYYASAGLVGTTLGIGIGQAMTRAKHALTHESYAAA